MQPRKVVKSNLPRALPADRQSNSYQTFNTSQQVRTQAARISEAVHNNHEELFPNHQSTLKVTDPELIEIFDNFAFDLD